MMMRLFVAVDLDDRIKEDLTVVRRELAVTGANVTSRQNLHFTMKFIGEGRPELAVKKLKAALAGQRAFTAEVMGIGGFPDDKRPRIIWAGAPELLGLQKKIITAFGQGGEDAVPHATLARAGKPDPRLSSIISRHKNASFGFMNVKTVKLKNSVLGHGGPVYSDIASFDLA